MLFRDLVPEVGASSLGVSGLPTFNLQLILFTCFCIFVQVCLNTKLSTATLQQNFRCVLRNNSFDEVVFNNIQRRASC